MSTPVEVFARSNSLSDTDSVLSLQPYSSESAESEEDDASTADLNPAPASAFARLKSLLQQRDSQLSTDQQERSSEAPLAEASERQLLTVRTLCVHLLRFVYEAVTSADCLTSFFSAQLDLELSQSENWSIKAADVAGQPDDLLEEFSEASLGCNESFAADTQQYAQAPKSALAESSAKLLQFQAQEAADRAAQRQHKQQQVLLLQQALARQQHAAGRHHTAFHTAAPVSECCNHSIVTQQAMRCKALFDQPHVCSTEDSTSQLSFADNKSDLRRHVLNACRSVLPIINS